MIIHELRRLDYPRRLKMLKITTLETRNMRANLLEIINGLHSIFPADFLWKMSMAKEEGTLTA